MINCDDCKHTNTSRLVEPCKSYLGYKNFEIGINEEESTLSGKPKDEFGFVAINRMCEESSPHGIPLGAPGCKLSAGKPKLSFAIDGFPMALKAVAAVGQFGHEEKGYGLNSWKTVPDGEKEYHEARYRHQTDIAKGEYRDSQSGYPHLFHVAWNALAELELHIQNNPDCFQRDK